jgi:hypothetical protein
MDVGGEERMRGSPDLHSFRLKSDAQKIQKGGIYIIWRTLLKNNSRFFFKLVTASHMDHTRSHVGFNV